MKEVVINSRYGDKVKFIVSSKEVVMSSEAEASYYRAAYKNDYSNAYGEFMASNFFDGRSRKDFEESIEGDELLRDNFMKYAESTSELSYVNLPGGPFVSTGMDLGALSREMDGLVVESIEVKGGGLIILKL